MLPTKTLFRTKDTHRLKGDGKRYFMQLEMTRKSGQQYSNQTKKTLKQSLQHNTKKGII